MKDKMYRPEVQGPKIPTPLPAKPKPGVVNKPKPPVGGRPQKPGAVNKPSFNKPANAKAEAIKNYLLGQKKGK